MITATAEVLDRGDMKVKITMTMTWSEWNKIMQQLDGTSYPDWAVRSCLRQVLGKLDATVQEGTFEAHQ